MAKRKPKKPAPEKIGICARCKSRDYLSSDVYQFPRPFGRTGSGRICALCRAELKASPGEVRYTSY